MRATHIQRAVLLARLPRGAICASIEDLLPLLRALYDTTPRWRPVRRAELHSLINALESYRRKYCY